MLGSVSPDGTYDAVILGGGLAGLTLARQLRIEAPHIRVLVVEKRKHPVREAAFKVGESSVEIGAHYLQVVLKLEPHLRAGQLEKLGLRYFFPQGDNRDLARRVELGPPMYPPVPSFQLDRGRLENHLLDELRQSGVEVLDDCSVKQIALQPLNHTVRIETPGRAGARGAGAMGRGRQRPRGFDQTTTRVDRRPPTTARTRAGSAFPSG